MSKEKKDRIVSPVGIAVYPRINEPNTKFNPDGVYSIKLRLGKEEGENFIEPLKQQFEEFYKDTCKKEKKAKLKRADLPWKTAEDDEGNETDEIEVSAKVPAKITSKKTGKSYTFKPALFDSKLVPTNVKVGGGSKVKIAVEPNLFYNGALGAGISLRLRAVQVIELVEFDGTGNGKSYGFGEEEGFVAPEEEATENNSTEETTEGETEPSDTDF